MRKTLWIIALLVFVPHAKAETFQVTSGFFQPIGAAGDNISLSGDGFTANGNIYLAPVACRGNFLPGQPITGCAERSVTGLVTLIHNGVEEQLEYGFDWNLPIGQASMLLSGVTQATLSETATFGPLTGCDNAAVFPACADTTFVIPGDALFTISLVQDPFSGGYDVTSEEYTITTPEPSTGSLMLIGAGMSVLAFRKRIAQCLQQTI
jgi:hypothetical protein